MDLSPPHTHAPAREIPPTLPEPGDPARFLDRQASELEYHARVLAMAADPDQPWLERARFLAFFASLTDEFFRVRVAGLKEQIAAGVTDRSRGGHSAREQVRQLQVRFAELVDYQRQLWVEEVAPGLAAHGVRIVTWDELDAAHQRSLSQVFEDAIFPVLTPLAVGPAHPFPFISDLSLSIGVTLDSARPGLMFARIKMPKLIDRLVAVPETDEDVFVPVEEVVAAHLHRLFPGREITGWHTFRVTRNADYEVEEVEVDDLLDAVASEIAERRFGRVVRLELDDRVPDEVRRLLLRELDVTDDDVVVSSAPLALEMLSDLHAIDRPDLKHPEMQSIEPLRLHDRDVFAAIDEGDILVQHPYESFTATTQHFIERAAADPDVVAIKQTLYRTSGDSPIVQALIRAARAGKQVVALVELKARFDEAANIEWAGQLEEAGVHVVYGFVELKTHTKTSLVVRRTSDGSVRRYGHIATGNYNPATARFYEDLGFFTADPQLTADLGELFNMLTGHSLQATPKKLLVAPVTLKARLLDLIKAQAHDQGRIVIKANNLSHDEIIHGLYEASQAGCEIDLLIRSICCLRPGIAGLSESIRVRSVVGPILEHSRIFRFGRGSDSEFLLGSADLMPRNLDNRVESVAPVEDPALCARLDEILDILLEDTALSWTLQPDGTWDRVVPSEGSGAVNAQARLARRARERGGVPSRSA